GFGRRAVADSDVIVEAVSTAKAIGWKAPVKVMWTREDDMTGGRYRPMYVHALKAGLGKRGRPTAWHHRVVGQSIMKGTPFEGGLQTNGVDVTTVEGAVNLPYEVPNLRIEAITTDVGVPVLWWRAVGSTHNAFATECFIDEMARASNKDPLFYRLDILNGWPRHQAALIHVRDVSRWGKKLPKGWGRGVAVAASFGSVVAQVAEVSVADGKLKVERVVCAVDCGLVVNPDNVKAQMEGGIGFALGAALKGAITLEDGRVMQANFDGYPVLTMDEMPRVEVHIMKSRNKPTGVGEPGVPPTAPAVCNAIFDAIGKRIRRLPINLTDLSL
ncbi:MAG: xanthine dehydrogenase family protein molybdopterin-binding subunit, partial [Alphaproteobacteria bacterium]|nr:xanthine dehydrogenase family protein molybdopterin-binding subunit [Alphaproteobacteria bacterium]